MGGRRDRERARPQRSPPAHARAKLRHGSARRPGPRSGAWLDARRRRRCAPRRRAGRRLSRPLSDLLTTVPAARAFCEAARARGAAVGLVPTMGALHDGHRSLLRQSLAQNDVTVVSIFVNPLQFGAGEDLEAYPRGFENDLRICAGEGAAAVFAPSEAEMYPQPPVTSLDFGGLSASLEGACRPGHL
ncbi:MAG: 4-phosphopantoate--beta-alanine ligase, partial [Acidimicrobiia bacterium]|nr:4-phosphopantoate--beta-alanine ligase [Acidimicrobiia bacterium]